MSVNQGEDMTDSPFQKEIGRQLVDEVRAGRMSRRQLLVRASVVGLSATAVGRLLVACGGSGTSASSPSASAAASGSAASKPAGEPIRFGMVIAVTGSFSPWYAPTMGGTDVVVQEINAAGGILGRPLEAIVSDDKSSVEGAVSAFSYLTDIKKVHAVSVSESDAIAALRQQVKDKQIPTVAPPCGTSELDKGGGASNYIWRFTASDTDLGVIAAQMVRDLKWPTLSMIVQNSTGPASISEVFKRTYIGAVGGQVLADVRIDPGQSDYSAQLEQAYAKDPAGLYLGVSYEQGGIILNEWQRRGYGGMIVSTSDLISTEIEQLSTQGVKISDGVMRIPLNAYDIESPTFKSYAPRYKALTGKDATAGVNVDAPEYDAFLALAFAMTKAGTTDGPAVAAAMADVVNPPGKKVYSYAEGLAALKAGEDIDFQGATSNCDMNEWGNLLEPLFGMQEIVDGKFKQVQSMTLDSSLRTTTTS